jgi:hypothetical protein
LRFGWASLFIHIQLNTCTGLLTFALCNTRLAPVIPVFNYLTIAYVKERLNGETGKWRN